MDKRPIGVFDSGLGGLTVLKEIKNKLPNESTIYFGDTARVPYGGKTKEQILEYTKEAIEFFISKNVKAVVIACNTATASALFEVRGKYNLPIIGVIEPGARSVSSVSVKKEVLVLGTEGTINSKAYEYEINKIDDNIKILSKACPAFVPIVENGMVGTSIAYGVVNEVLKEFKNTNIDSIVLGCTHYPYLEKEITEVMGKQVSLINPAIETVKDLKEVLKENTILNLEEGYTVSEFYVSGNTEKFRESAQRFMREEISFVHKVEKNDVEMIKKVVV